jgi:hypothetical protein
VKYFILVAWVLAILSARGYDACAARAGRGRSQKPVMTLAVAGIVALVFVMMAQTADPVMRPGLSIARAICVAVITICLILMVGARAQRFGLALLPLLDLVAAGSHLNPVAPASFYSERRLSRALGTVTAECLAPCPKGLPQNADRRRSAADSLAGGFRWDHDPAQRDLFSWRPSCRSGQRAARRDARAALGRMLGEGGQYGIARGGRAARSPPWTV